LSSLKEMRDDEALEVYRGKKKISVSIEDKEYDVTSRYALT